MDLRFYVTLAQIRQDYNRKFDNIPSKQKTNKNTIFLLILFKYP